MGFLAFALAIMAVTYTTLLGGWRSPNGMQYVGMDGQGMVLALLAVGAAMWFFGPLYGLAFTLSVAIHEFGHVAAYRVCGHADARFRLIPLMGGVAISNQIPASHERQLFISIMGPAICIGPMLAGFALSDLLYYTSPQVADFFYIFAIVTGALNFFNLLPFWPLDGGRIVQILAYSFWPPAGRVVAILMSGALVLAAIAMQSLVLFVFALMGAQSLMGAHHLAEIQRTMKRPRALLCLAAYVATTLTFGIGGLSFILSWL